ncbi:Endoribonuclease YbeY [Pelotomaculum schinkii]|uniref:Endoribonuclease YbeY n=1 Tax=Pelotomaculum schinkii TaxID=78350 RepID=A0A4Y7RDZ9_9FIRM|nr:rRNA maturation RNase YbeY [Pelotomaculum schinkii]TEB07214.1 Endoribonuclease YbeY [Pelotomaculum schinkii]
MSVLVSNLQDEVTVDDDLAEFLSGVAEAVLKSEGYGEDAEVSLVLVDDTYIRSLNSEYRGIDSPTDVLSFAMLEGEALPGQEEELILGDVVVSVQTARRQADEYGHSFRRETAYLTAHGVLHLLGYDHQEEEGREMMRLKEEEILASLNISR